MPVSQEVWKVITAFQRYLKSGDSTEIARFSLSEIQAADEQLGNRDVDADFRLAMQNRIKAL